MKTRVLGLVLALCLAVCAAAAGETQAVNRESNGKIQETIWQDENGQAVPGPEGYYSVQYTYKGSNTIERYFGADGEPYETAGGYYGRRTEKDAKGNVIETEYLDENGERTLNRAGYALMGVTYYGFGEVRSVTYYGMNKKAVVVPSLGYASVYNEYSGKTMTSRTYRDAKGNPVDCADGYAVKKQKVNKRYQVLSIRYDHADGSPATGPDGWFRCVKERDDKGRLTSVKYYDVNMQQTDRGAGYAWEGYSYEGDDVVRVTRYGLNGEMIADSAGVAVTVREMKDEQIVKERFLDKDGNRVTNQAGVGEIRYGYGPGGSVEKVSYYDTEGNPVLCGMGYAGYRDAFDGDGAAVSRVFFGTDGQAVEISGGYSEIRWQYDEAKQIISTRYYDLDGKQVDF